MPIVPHGVTEEVHQGNGVVLAAEGDCEVAWHVDISAVGVDPVDVLVVSVATFSEVILDVLVPCLVNQVDQDVPRGRRQADIGIASLELNCHGRNRRVVSRWSSHRVYSVQHHVVSSDIPGVGGRRVVVIEGIDEAILVVASEDECGNVFEAVLEGMFAEAWIPKSRMTFSRNFLRAIVQGLVRVVQIARRSLLEVWVNLE